MIKTSFHFHLLVIVTGVLLILVSFATVSVRDFEVIFMNSDCLYLPSIYKDLFWDNGNIAYWSFNAAPNVFPDMIVYFILMSLTNNFVICSILFSVFQYVIIALLVNAIFKKINYRAQMTQRVWIQLMLLIPHTFTLFTHDFSLHFQFLSNAYHLGALVNTLVCWLIYQKIIHKPFDKLNIVRLILFCCLLYISSVSDKLFWVLFLAPIFITSIYHYFNTKNYNTLLFSVLTLVTFVVSNWTLNAMRYTTPKIDAPFRNMSTDHIGESIRIFIQHMKITLMEGNIKSIFIALVVSAIVIYSYLTMRLIFRFRKQQTIQKNEFTIFITFSIVFGIIAPIANGSYSGYDTIRYNFPAMILALIGFAIATTPILPAVKTRFIFPVMLIFNFSLLFLFIVKRDNFRKKWHFLPQQTSEIEMLAKQYTLKAGVAEYWSAKKNDVFNTKGIKILPLLGNRGMYIHANSKYWYLYQRKTKQQEVFNFAIIDDADQVEKLEKLFGSNCPIVRFGETNIMLTPDFIFDPQTELIELVRVQKGI